MCRRGVQHDRVIGSVGPADFGDRQGHPDRAAIPRDDLRCQSYRLTLAKQFFQSLGKSRAITDR